MAEVSNIEGSKAAPRSRSFRHWYLAAAGVAIIGFGYLLYANAVPVELTDEDRASIDQILTKGGHGDIVGLRTAPNDFADQVRIIRDVQDAVLTISPNSGGIALNQTREPKDLLRAANGECYDNSRSIEKALTMLGFVARHVFIYESKNGVGGLFYLLKPRLDSHAVAEVRTAKGWMMVDSVSRWIGLTADDHPISTADVRSSIKRSAAWHPATRGKMHSIFRKPIGYVIGLYSRHGHFYPPYTPIPDINWREMLYNITG